MRPSARTLGRSAEDCLEAIFVLGRRTRHIRVRDLSRRLGVTCPTVVSALVALEKKGLVKHERYGSVELTGRGRVVADDVDRRHRLLERFLVDVLGVNPEVAAIDACRLEHGLSPETLRRLRGFVQQRSWARRG